MKIIQDLKENMDQNLRISLTLTNRQDLFMTMIRKLQDTYIEEILDNMNSLIMSNSFIKHEDINVEILLISEPSGHGFKSRCFVDIKLPKYFIDNMSNSCFWDSISYYNLKYIVKRSQIIPKQQIKSEGKNISQKINKTYNTPVYISDIAEIEASIGWRICIFHISSNDDIKTLYKPKIKDQKKNIIYLLLHNNTYYPVKTPKLLLKRTSKENLARTGFCNICYEFIKNLTEHLCTEFCSLCLSSNTCNQSGQNDFIKCVTCCRTLKNRICFEAHKKSGACKRSRICQDCMVEYKFNSHDCKYSTCSVCFKKYKNDGSSDHICIMIPKTKVSSKVNNIIRIYFDIEAYKASNNIFIPTLLISQTICDNCETDDQKCSTYHFGSENIYHSDHQSTCIMKFLKHLLKIDDLHKSIQIVVIAHNLGGFDGLFLYNELLDNFPDDILKSGIIKRGNKIITFKIGKSIQFRDSLLYVPCSLKKLPSLFNIPNKSKGFFPHEFYGADTLNYIGPIPDKNYFDRSKMNEDDLIEFDEFHKLKSDLGIYDIKKEIIEYCKDDVTILRLSMEKFRMRTLSSFTVDPFTDACTIASNCFTIYINNFLPKGVDVISIDRTVRKRYSIEGITWIQIQEKKLNKQLISGTDFTGEKRIKLRNGDVIFPDGYDQENRTVFLYNGCFWHGCPQCNYDKILRDGIPGMEYYLKTKRIEDQIRKEFNIVTTWSHDQKLKRITNPSYNALWTDLYEKNRFDNRLQPGDSLFGGRTNAFRLLITEEELDQTDSQIKYFDFCSLYPSVQVKYPYPTGKPEIILKKDLPSIKDFVYDNGDKYFGLVKLRILPPNDLLFPVLPIIVNKKLFFPLCIKCSEDQLSSTDCYHTDFERSWIGTYVSVEVFKAIEEGYVILEIYEIWNFKRTPDLFKSYIQHFIKQKLEASGYPTGVETDLEKDEYIKHVKDKDGIQLTKEDIKRNPPSRTLAKLCLNNLWGKFCQNPDKTQTKICSDYTEFIEAVFESNKIISSLFMTDKKAVIDYKVPLEEIKPGRYTNIPIGAFTTAYARLELYKIMKQLDDRLLYVDTDSLIFISSPEKPDPPLGSSLGELTDEIAPEFGPDSRGIAFVSTGPKSYSLKVRKSCGGLDTLVKCKGFSITNELKDKINFDGMAEIVKGDIDSIKTDSIRFQPLKYGGVKMTDNKKTLKNTYTKRRVVERFRTLPWGFRKQT